MVPARWREAGEHWSLSFAWRDQWLPVTFRWLNHTTPSVVRGEGRSEDWLAALRHQLRQHVGGRAFDEVLLLGEEVVQNVGEGGLEGTKMPLVRRLVREKDAVTENQLIAVLETA